MSACSLLRTLVIGLLCVRCAFVSPLPSGPDGGEANDSGIDTGALEDSDPNHDGGDDADVSADGDAGDASRLDASEDADEIHDAEEILDADDGGSDGDTLDGGDHDDDEPVVSDLDPDLGLPDPSGDPCDTPGGMWECDFLEVCRFYSSSEGRCESCEPCGNLNDFCSSSSECDILFMCYLGHCTNFCTLDTYMCGPIEDCVDIGHPTHGVCIPW